MIFILFGIYFILKKFPIFLDLIMVVLLSFIISYSLRPYYKFLIKKGMNSRLSALVVILSIILGIIIIFTILIPSIFNESENLNGLLITIEEYISKFKNLKIPMGNNEYIANFMTVVYEKVQLLFNELANSAIEKIIQLGENILLFLIVPTVIYFFLCDDNLILSGLLKFIPNSERQALRKTLLHIDKVLERYIITQFELCGIIGVLTFFSLAFLKVKFPVLLSVINAIFNIIPYFGPVIGAVPIIILSSMTSIRTAVYVSIVLAIIQQVEGDIIGPKIIGDSVNAHPLTILILLLIGGNIGGIIGMIIVIPIWVTIKVIYEDIEAYLF
ncbi:AI-2E family transporter [Clostridium senegalense]|uniref:AI-2E family transporter n=1 Tax=Clostridium senegalense TaxID=1465809 RepID=UPI000289306D|nr:AI-2E family transporter [Clostridium senegalense]